MRISATKSLGPIFAIALLAAMVAQSCGSGGSDDDNDDDGDSGTDGVSSITNNNFLKGTFELGAGGDPAEGFQVWILDHTERKFSSIELDEVGSFSYPVKYLSSGSKYTLHLVTSELVEVGMIDMSPTTAGIQGAVTYGGGVGYDMGTQTVTLDSMGKIDFSTPGLESSVGGDFSVDVDDATVFSDFPFPEYTNGVTTEGDLSVLDANILLNAFYLREQHPELYRRELNSRSKIIANVIAKEKADINRVNVFQAGAWLQSSRVATSDSQGPGSSVLWNKTGYDLASDGDRTFSANIFTGKLISPGSIAILKIVPEGTAREFIGPSILRHVFTMPPKIVGINLVGGTPGTIDYANVTAQNGLTRPFCTIGNDVVLDVSPPENHLGVAVSHDDLDKVVVDYTYFELVDGVATAVSPNSSDFPTAFQEEYADTVGGVDRRWSFSSKRATLALSASAGATSPRRLSLWGETFIGTADSKTVDRIRLYLYFQHSSQKQKSGIVVWLDPNC